MVIALVYWWLIVKWLRFVLICVCWCLLFRLFVLLYWLIDYALLAGFVCGFVWTCCGFLVWVIWFVGLLVCVVFRFRLIVCFEYLVWVGILLWLLIWFGCCGLFMFVVCGLYLLLCMYLV